MKYAICFYGYFGQMNIMHKMIQLNNNKLNDYDDMIPIKLYKKNIIDPNINNGDEVDIFFHCWNTNKSDQQKLIEEYKPVSYLFEDQKNTKFISDIEMKTGLKFTGTYLPRWYSEYKSIQLLTTYEKNNNVKYDLVLHTIFDQLFFTPIIFSKLDKNMIYNSYWNNYNIKDNYHYDRKSGLYDQWYISNPSILTILSNYETLMSLYNSKKYKGTHYFRLQIIKDNNLFEKLNFMLYVGFDHVKMNQIFLNEYKHCLNKI